MGYLYSYQASYSLMQSKSSSFPRCSIYNLNQITVGNILCLMTFSAYTSVKVTKLSFNICSWKYVPMLIIMPLPQRPKVLKEFGSSPINPQLSYCVPVDRDPTSALSECSILMLPDDSLGNDSKLLSWKELDTWSSSLHFVLLLLRISHSTLCFFCIREIGSTRKILMRVFLLHMRRTQIQLTWLSTSQSAQIH